MPMPMPMPVPAPRISDSSLAHAQLTYQPLDLVRDFRWNYPLQMTATGGPESGGGGGPCKVNPNIVSEGHTYYFLTDRGEFLFIQIVYANLAIRPAWQVSARYYRPPWGPTDPGTNAFYSENHLFTGHELRTPSDGISGIFGPLVYQVEPGSGGSSGHKNKVSLTFAQEGLFMRLSVTLEIPPFQRATGRNALIRRRTLRPDGVIVLKFGPFLRFAGEVQVRGVHGMERRPVSGVGCMGFLSMQDGLTPYRALQWSNYCVFRARTTPGVPGISLSMLTFVPTSAYTETSALNQGMILVEDRVWGLSVGTNLQPEDGGSSIEYGPLVEEPLSGYRLPAWVSYHWRGRTLDLQHPWEVTLRTEVRSFLDRINLLGKLPPFLATVIRVFITNPWAFLLLEPSVQAVLNIPALGLRGVPILGTLYHEVSYFTQPTFK